MQRNKAVLYILFLLLSVVFVACKPSGKKGELRKVEIQSEKSYQVEVPLLDTTEVTIIKN